MLDAMVFPLQPQSRGVFRKASSPEDRASYRGNGDVCGVWVSWSLVDTCLHPQFLGLWLLPPGCPCQLSQPQLDGPTRCPPHSAPSQVSRRRREGRGSPGEVSVRLKEGAGAGVRGMVTALPAGLVWDLGFTHFPIQCLLPSLSPALVAPPSHLWLSG